VFYFKNSKTLGEAILMLRGLLNEWQWYWTCIGILFGFTLVFNILSILALQFLKCMYDKQTQILFLTEGIRILMLLITFAAPHILMLLITFAAPHKREVNIKSQDRQNKVYNDQAVVNVNASIDQSLPFQPLTLVFKNINYSVKLPKVLSRLRKSFQNP
jgi:cytochrome c biogenesis protein CcdA